MIMQKSTLVYITLILRLSMALFINFYMHILNKTVSLNIKLFIYSKLLAHYLFIEKFLNIFGVMQFLHV